MRRILLLILVLGVWQGCTTLHRIKSNRILASANLNVSNFHSGVYYESTASLQIFEVLIEGKSYRFIFDTGGYTVFSEELINTLKGIREVSYIDVKDGNNVTSRIKTYLLEELKIGNISFSNIGFAKIGYTESEWFKCLGLDGTIGPNIMKECFWLFDNEAKQIILTDDDKKLAIIQHGIKVPIHVDNVFKPSVDFQIGNYHGKAGFDTGFNGLLSLLEGPEFDLFELYPSIAKLGNRSNAGHSSVYSNSRVIKLDSIAFNGLILKNILVSSRNNSSSNLLGSEIFDYYRVMIDLSGKAMYFEEISENSMPVSKIVSFGIGFDYLDGKVVVGYVYEASSAYEKGIEPGEQIVKINGQMYEFSSYCEFVENFSTPDSNQIEIELIRNSKPFLITLTKENIF